MKSDNQACGSGNVISLCPLAEEGRIGPLHMQRVTIRGWASTHLGAVCRFKPRSNGPHAAPNIVLGY